MYPWKIDMTALSDVQASSLFRTVFEAEFDYVWASLARLGVHPADLEDVAQEVFLLVYQRLSDYDSGRPLRPWLFAFAFRLASDYRRLARHRGRPLNEDADVPPDIASVEQLVADKEAFDLMVRALASIDLERRAVFILHELDEIPMQEIADALGIPRNTAYSRLRVAREEFTAAARELLEEQRRRR